MAVAQFQDIFDLVQQSVDQATEAADTIKLGECKHYARGKVELSLLADVPRYSRLPQFYGVKAWAAILSVDLRKSSQRALRIGARNTYITMHALLPTMTVLVEKAEGLIVGLRGDGLIASFGLTELVGTGKELTGEAAGKAVQDAVCCGKAMLEAVDQIINPALEKKRVEGGLQIGVGVDVGEMVVTRIGWGRADDVTAYGHCVNNACKMKPSRDVLVTHTARRMFPTSGNGRVRFSQSGTDYRVIFPDDMRMLSRAAKAG